MKMKKGENDGTIKQTNRSKGYDSLCNVHGIDYCRSVHSHSDSVCTVYVTIVIYHAGRAFVREEIRYNERTSLHTPWYLQKVEV